MADKPNGSPRKSSRDSKDEAREDTAKEDQNGEIQEASSKDNPDRSTGEESGHSKEESTNEKEPVELPEDFFYNVEDHWSRPIKSDPEQSDYLVTLYHSFGYHCHMRHNLHALRHNRLIFSAGCFLQITHIGHAEYVYEFLPTTGGGSIGALTVHPTGDLFAVGERGNSPDINIYDAEEYRLYRILRKGTTNAYNAVCFNNTGDLLASQGAEPDFMLTVWNWKQEAVLLRCKSFSQEVNHVSFNRDLVGSLCTAGCGHIKFWKMARTFTGLKLQGQVGRFGKTPISDIEGYIEFPDGKTLSGSDWGNMLLWDEHLVKLEVGRKNGKKCHDGQIMHMMIVEGEIITAGMDGFVRSWNFELIDMLDVSEESGLVEIDAMNEVLIGPNVNIYHLTHPPREASKYASAADVSQDGQEDTEEVRVRRAEGEAKRHMWYCQDGAGAIWEADLSFRMAANEPKKLLTFHAGAIVACVVSPKTYLVITLGEDGTLRLYDFLKRELLAIKEFTAKGCSLVWIPVCVDDKFNAVMAGFSDGGIRKVVIEGSTTTLFGVDHLECQLKLTKALKPHSADVTGIAYSHAGSTDSQTTMVTCSVDKTIFFFDVKAEDRYQPLCFVPLLYVPRDVAWSPDDNSPDVVMITCNDGYVIEMARPFEWQLNRTDSYVLTDANMRIFRFTSVKSQILHDEEVAREEEEGARREKEEEERNKMLLLRAQETPSKQQLRIENEKAMAAAERKLREQTEEPWKPYIPPIPSPILQTLYLGPDCSFWLTLGGYDGGYFYECHFTRPFRFSEEGKEMEVDMTPPINAVRLEGAEEEAVSAMSFSAEGQEVFLGTESGKIRVQFLDGEFDLSSQRGHWTMGAHDQLMGAITGLKLSHDESFLISVGKDGNFFVFNLEPVLDILERNTRAEAEVPVGSQDDVKVEDLQPNEYTIEESQQRKDHDYKVMTAEKRKQEKKVDISVLRTRFIRLLAANQTLPERHRLSQDEFVLHDSLAEDMEKLKQKKLEDMKRKIAWESEKIDLGYRKLYNHFRRPVLSDRFCVNAFGSEHTIWSYALDNRPLKKMTIFKRPYTLTANFGVDDGSGNLVNDEEEELKKMMDSVLTSDSFTGASERTRYLLRKVLQKKLKRAKRKVAWRRFLATKPGDDFEDPADVEAIQNARTNLGHRVLKTEDSYLVPDSYKLTMVDGAKRLHRCESWLYRKQMDFNKELRSLREFKTTTIREIERLITRMQMIQDHLSETYYEVIPRYPYLDLDEEPGGKFSLDPAMESRLKLEVQEHRHQRDAEKNVKTSTAFSMKPRRKSSVAAARENYSRRMSRKASLMSESNALTFPSAGQFRPNVRVDFMSPLQTELLNIEQIELTYEQSVLLKQIQEKSDLFDIQHRQLRHDKFLLDVVTKVAQLHITILQEEQLLLMDCEQTENAINDRIEASLEVKNQGEKMAKQLQSQAGKHAKELEELGKKENALFLELENIIGEGNPFRDYLVRVYKKKVKRKDPNRVEAGHDDDSSESDSESSDEDEGSDEDDEDAVHYDLNVCPPECSAEIYKKVVQLREDRQDLDEATADVKKTRDSLLKEVEALVKKRQTTEQTFIKAQKELAAFQVEKQHRINDLITVVTIHFHQIQYLQRNGNFKIVTDELLMEEQELIRLQNRIKELKTEKKNEKKKTDQRRKQHSQLKYEKNLFLDRLAIMEEDSKKEMRKKFGKVVDMEVVETVVADPQLEDARSRLCRVQNACDQEMQQCLQELKSMRLLNVHSLRMDTEWKAAETELKTAKMDLEKQLNSCTGINKMRTEDNAQAVPSDLLELTEIVQQQHTTIADLNAEINFLQRGVPHSKMNMRDMNKQC